MLKKYFMYLRTLGTLFVDLIINDSKKEGKKSSKNSKNNVLYHFYVYKFYKNYSECEIDHIESVS